MENNIFVEIISTWLGTTKMATHNQQNLYHVLCTIILWHIFLDLDCFEALQYSMSTFIMNMVLSVILLYYYLAESCFINFFFWEYPFVFLKNPFTQLEKWWNLTKLLEWQSYYLFSFFCFMVPKHVLSATQFLK